MRPISIFASTFLCRFGSWLAAFCLLCSTTAIAQPKVIAAGLWENKVSSPELDAARAQMEAQMASMPAAQRAQMEKMMAANGAMMSKDGASKVCITPEMAKADPSAGSTPEGCRQNLSWSGNTAKMEFSCKDGAQGKGEFTYASDKAYSGWIESQGKSAKPSRMTVSAKWLGADCGAVKPFKR
jgi:Protein of unknown function (DUF3617)